ncbi:MAG TPA: hypothetical protein PK691_01395, partial [Thermomicrobiales bacterium]|nr:hypothetical protein [Thermomicrobiales bacterium]
MLRKFFSLAVIAIMLAAGLGQFPAAASDSSPGVRFLYGSGSQTGGRNITLRVRLTAPAPAGGVAVSLTSSSPAIQVPATITVKSGQTEKQFTVPTIAVATDQDVTLSATANGLTKARVVHLRAAHLSRLSLQRVIRSGGIGRIMIVLSGPAPVGGLTVTGSSSPSDILAFDGSYIIPAGADRLVVKAAANLAGLTFDTAEAASSQHVAVTVHSGSYELNGTT